ncbi:dihydroneopterin aldolase [Vagococcus humatus]|uniref:7,8-dihydroneopterin aldolase n=1 Tax=Vagococcus humatus TaxID=1889241 RepID=A0A429Z6W7_9ENTE|nr:dihydroneopterin aldolase [Vagococcus humatus]RST89405.1 dihydroneopterin aldolase [Vagococcus humatus]
MDKIQLVGLEVFAYHGVNPEEKRDGQTFILDVTLKTDISKPGASDDLNETINYAKVRKTITRVMTEETYDLIEKAASEVAKAILTEYPAVKKVNVTLKKPEAPMNATFDYVAVSISRERSDFE